MADPGVQREESEAQEGQDQTPLLINTEQQRGNSGGEGFDTHLDKTLQRLFWLPCLFFAFRTICASMASENFYLSIGTKAKWSGFTMSTFGRFRKLLERESDVWIFIEEHVRLRYHLSEISHRFRIYLLLAFLVVTASQFVTLFQTTGYSGIISIINGGDFAVSSIVQVVGIIICLNAAAKISHKAQGIASLASRWHASVTCRPSNASQLRVSNSVGNLEAARPFGSLYINNSESDLESLDDIVMPTNTQLASYMSSYHKRQAFVMYLQSNPGGITIFGWTVDRGLINTIFFIELSLVLFVLGKTIVFTSK